MEKETPTNIQTTETEVLQQQPEKVIQIEAQDSNNQVSKYADYVHGDGRKWSELKPEEKKRVKKKLAKKMKKKVINSNPLVQETTKFRNSDKTTTYEEELKWCIDQLKLGLSANAVTMDQCK